MGRVCLGVSLTRCRCLIFIGHSTYLLRCTLLSTQQCKEKVKGMIDPRFNAEYR